MGYHPYIEERSDLIRATERKYRLPENLLMNIAQKETGGLRNLKDLSVAESPRGASGLYQFMPDTAKWLGVNPMDSNSSIEGAGKYMSMLMKMFDGNVRSALAAYNAGQGSVMDFKNGTNKTGKNPRLRKTEDGIPPWRETSDYVNTIVKASPSTEGFDYDTVLASSQDTATADLEIARLRRDILDKRELQKELAIQDELKKKYPEQDLFTSEVVVGQRERDWRDIEYGTMEAPMPAAEREYLEEKRKKQGEVPFSKLIDDTFKYNTVLVDLDNWYYEATEFGSNKDNSYKVLAEETTAFLDSIEMPRDSEEREKAYEYLTEANSFDQSVFRTTNIMNKWRTMQEVSSQGTATALGVGAIALIADPLTYIPISGGPLAKGIGVLSPAARNSMAFRAFEGSKIARGATDVGVAALASGALSMAIDPMAGASQVAKGVVSGAILGGTIGAASRGLGSAADAYHSATARRAAARAERGAAASAAREAAAANAEREAAAGAARVNPMDNLEPHLSVTPERFEAAQAKAIAAQPDAPESVKTIIAGELIERDNSVARATVAHAMAEEMVTQGNSAEDIAAILSGLTSREKTMVLHLGDSGVFQKKPELKQEVKALLKAEATPPVAVEKIPEAPVTKSSIEALDTQPIDTKEITEGITQGDSKDIITDIEDNIELKKEVEPLVKASDDFIMDIEETTVKIHNDEYQEVFEEIKTSKALTRQEVSNVIEEEYQKVDVGKALIQTKSYATIEGEYRDITPKAAPPVEEPQVVDGGDNGFINKMNEWSAQFNVSPGALGNLTSPLKLNVMSDTFLNLKNPKLNFLIGTLLEAGSIYKVKGKGTPVSFGTSIEKAVRIQNEKYTLLLEDSFDKAFQTYRKSTGRSQGDFMSEVKLRSYVPEAVVDPSVETFVSELMDFEVHMGSRLVKAGLMKEEELIKENYIPRKVDYDKIIDMREKGIISEDYREIEDLVYNASVNYHKSPKGDVFRSKNAENYKEKKVKAMTETNSLFYSLEKLEGLTGDVGSVMQDIERLLAEDSIKDAQNVYKSFIKTLPKAARRNVKEKLIEVELAWKNLIKADTFSKAWQAIVEKMARKGAARFVASLKEADEIRYGVDRLNVYGKKNIDQMIEDARKVIDEMRDDEFVLLSKGERLVETVKKEDLFTTFEAVFEEMKKNTKDRELAGNLHKRALYDMSTVNEDNTLSMLDLYQDDVMKVVSDTMRSNNGAIALSERLGVKEARDIDRIILGLDITKNSDKERVGNVLRLAFDNILNIPIVHHGDASKIFRVIRNAGSSLMSALFFIPQSFETLSTAALFKGSAMARAIPALGKLNSMAGKGELSKLEQRQLHYILRNEEAIIKGAMDDLMDKSYHMHRPEEYSSVASKVDGFVSRNTSKAYILNAMSLLSKTQKRLFIGMAEQETISVAKALVDKRVKNRSALEAALSSDGFPLDKQKYTADFIERAYTLYDGDFLGTLKKAGASKDVLRAIKNHMLSDVETRRLLIQGFSTNQEKAHRLLVRGYGNDELVPRSSLDYVVNTRKWSEAGMDDALDELSLIHGSHASNLLFDESLGLSYAALHSRSAGMSVVIETLLQFKKFTLNAGVNMWKKASGNPKDFRVWASLASTFLTAYAGMVALGYVRYPNNPEKRQEYLDSITIKNVMSRASALGVLPSLYGAVTTFVPSLKLPGESKRFSGLSTGIEGTPTVSMAQKLIDISISEPIDMVKRGELIPSKQTIKEAASLNPLRAFFPVQLMENAILNSEWYNDLDLPERRSKDSLFEGLIQQ